MQLYQIYSLIDFEEVGQLKTVEELYCFGMSKLIKFPFENNLINLKKVTFSDCNKLEDISALKNCLNLEELWIHGTRNLNVNCLTELRSLPKLKTEETSLGLIKKNKLAKNVLPLIHPEMEAYKKRLAEKNA